MLNYVLNCSLIKSSFMQNGKTYTIDENERHKINKIMINDISKCYKLANC